MIEVTLDLDKIPKQAIYQGKTGKKLFVTIGERKEPDQYGNTHYAYLWNKDTKEKTYIGSGKVKEWKAEQPNKPKEAHDDLPF